MRLSAQDWMMAQSLYERSIPTAEIARRFSTSPQNIRGGIRRRGTFIRQPRRATIPSLSEVDRAYIAGVFDGEGCICITTRNQRRYHSLRITVTNTHQGLIRFLHERLGGCVSPHSAREKCRPTWTWVAPDQRSENILVLLQPFLLVKKHQCELALEFRRLVKSAGHRLTIEDRRCRENLRLQLIRMNGGGKASLKP